MMALLLQINKGNRNIVGLSRFDVCCLTNYWVIVPAIWYKLRAYER